MTTSISQIKLIDKTEEDLELQRSLKIAESGSPMRRLQFRKLGPATIIKLSGDHTQLSYTSRNSLTCVPTKFKNVKISEILEVRAGWSTDNFQRTSVKPKFSSTVQENLCFSIIYRHPQSLRKSVDFVTESAEIQKAWVIALQHLLAEVKNASLHFNEEKWLKETFQHADVNNNGCLSFNEVFDLLSKLNLEIHKNQAKQIYEKADYKKQRDKTLEQGLEFDEFLMFFRVLTKRKDLLKVLRENSTENAVYFTPTDLKKFIENVQKESNVTLVECENLIKNYEPAEVNQKERIMTVQGFRNFLLSTEWGSIFNQSHNEVVQIMNLPLHNYYISSSHNTYLAGQQLAGNATIEGYVNVLQKGFRFLELDIWDGDKEPTITHGHTLVNPIRLRDVIKAINDYGFSMSKYPVILSLENHCSTHQQSQMATILKEMLGNKLYVPPPDCTEFPSPEALINKVVLKGKVAKYVAPAAIIVNSPQSDDFTDDEDKDVGAKIVESVTKPVVRFCADIMKPNIPMGYEMSNLTALPSCKLHNLVTDLTEHPYNGMVSIEEKKINKYVRNSFVDMVRYSSRHFVKIYPRGLRTGSSNYDPMPCWMSGAQCVSLNAQTLDEAYDINQGLFSMNGHCGYVLKPDLLRSGKLNLQELSNQNYRLTIHLTIISAQFLPKPTTTLAASDVIDPFVSVEIFGFPFDQQKRITKTISNNGFNPNWEEKFDIKLKYPEFALIRFLVKDYDKFSSNDFIGECSLHVESLKQGYRHITLNTGYAHLPDPSARLFVKVEFERHDDPKTLHNKK